MSKLVTIKIDKGVPILKGSGRRHGENIFPFAEMEVGDSFFVPFKKDKKQMSQRTSLHTCARLWAQYHKKNWTFSTSTLSDENGVRIWRTK